jgi:hypothetical protein
MSAFSSPGGATVSSQGRKPLETRRVQIKTLCSLGGATVRASPGLWTVAPPGLQGVNISNSSRGLRPWLLTVAPPGLRRTCQA